MHSVQSIMNYGSEGIVITIECHQSNGLPAMVIVGLGNKAIEESKERIRSAYVSAGLAFPRKRITINLAPADIPKESTTHLDLAITTAIMQCSQQVKQTLGTDAALIGELGLDGSVRPVRGIIGKVLYGQKHGIKKFYIPQENLSQALLVPDVSIFPVKNIKDLYLALNNEIVLRNYDSNSTATVDMLQAEKLSHKNYFGAVIGQNQAKRGLQIAAAGGHNILMSGPPGSGKSMLAKALRSILPPLTRQEMLEVTHIYSLVGNDYESLVTERPFRTPHHSASHASIVGGGSIIRPGEVTLSHRGVLFLDEMPEFNRPSLESLRQPLEDHAITITRARQTVRYPASFILVATANPCPCGYYGSPQDCSCTMQQVLAYGQKISGPIVDRIDLHVPVHSVSHEKILHTPAHDDTPVRQSVISARAIQKKRYGNTGKLNAHMDNEDIMAFAKPTAAAQQLLNTAANTLKISTRSYMRLLKVARTIADIENSLCVETVHISEALQYRPKSRQSI